MPELNVPGQLPDQDLFNSMFEDQPAPADELPDQELFDQMFDTEVEAPAPATSPDQISENLQGTAVQGPVAQFKGDPADTASGIPELNTDVYPNNWDATIDAHEARGRSFGGLRKDEGLRKASLKWAEGYALAILKRRGLIVDGVQQPGLEKGDVTALVNAARYMAVGIYAPLSADEEPQLDADAGVAVMQHISTGALDKLKGMNPQSPEAKQLQDIVQRAKQYETLINDKDPKVLRSVRGAFLIANRRMAVRRSGAEQSMSEMPWSAHPADPMDLQMQELANAQRSIGQLSYNDPKKVALRARAGDVNRLSSFLDESLAQVDTPDGAVKAMDSAYTGKLQASRLAAMGYPEDLANNFGMESAMWYANPALRARFSQLEAMLQVPGSQGEGTPDEMDARYRETGLGLETELMQSDLNAGLALEQFEIAPHEPTNAAALAANLEKFGIAAGESIGSAFKAASPALGAMGRWLNDAVDAVAETGVAGVQGGLPVPADYYDRVVAPARVLNAQTRIARAELEAMKELDDEPSSLTPDILNAAPWATDRESKDVPTAEAQALLNPEGDLFSAMVQDMAPATSQKAAQTAALFPHGTVGEQIYADVMSKTFDEAAPGDSDLFSAEGVDMIAQVTARSQTAWHNGTGTWGQYASDVFALAAVRYGTEVRDTTKMLFTNPKDFARISSIGAVVGVPVGVAALRARGAVINFLSKKFKNRRLRRLITVAQYRDPGTIPQAQEILAARYADAPTQKQAVAMDYVSAQLETNRKLQVTPIADGEVHADRVARISSNTARIQRELKRIDNRTLEEMATNMDLGQEMAEYVNNFSLRSFIAETASILKQDVLKLDKFSADGILHNSAQTVAQATVQAMDAGGEIPLSARDAGLSIDGLDAGGRPLTRHLAKHALDGRTPTGASHAALSRFYARTRGAVAERRAASAATRTRQDELLEYVKTLHEHDAASLRAARAQSDNPDVQEMIRERMIFHDQEASRIGQFQADVERAPWDQDVALSRVDFLNDEAKLPYEALAYHVEAAGDPMGLEGMYTRLSNPRETFAEFEARWNRLIQGSDTSAPTKDFSKEALLERRAMQQRVLREYYNTRGLDTQLNDGLTGKALTPMQARLLNDRRSAVKRHVVAIAKAGPDTKLTKSQILEAERTLRIIADDPDIGISGEGDIIKTNIREPVKTLRSLADADTAAQAAGVWTGRNGLDDGRLSTATQTLGNKIESLRMTRVAQRKRIRRITKALQRNPELRLAFRRALELSKEKGRHIDMAELRDLAPEAAAELPITSSEELDYLMQFDQDFRGGLLKDLSKVGFFTADEAADFAKPFLPVRYETRDGRVVTGKPGPKKADDLGTSGSSDNGLFEVQRDPTHYRVIVHRENVGNNTRAFPTEVEAMAWLSERYGIHGKLRRPKASEHPHLGHENDRVLETGSRQKAELIAPMGLDKHRRLIPGDPEVSLAERYTDLVEETAQYTFMKSMDRPGWTYADEKALQRSGLTPEDQTEFVQLPESRKFGALSGKMVHKNVKRDIDSYTYHFEHISNFAKATLKESAKQGIVAKVGSGIKSMYLKGAGAMKDMIITNAIARSGVGQATNLAADLAIFAHGATNGEIMGPRGRKYLIRAAKLLHDDFDPKTARMPDELAAALEAGGLDETIMGTGLDDSIRKDLIELKNGRVPWLDHMKNEFERFQMGLGFEKAADIPTAYRRAIGVESGDAQLESLFAKWESLEDTYTKIMDGELTNFSTDEIAGITSTKLDIENRIRAAEPTMMNSLLRGGRLLQHIAFGRRRGHFGEAEVFSRQMYGQASNVSRLASFLYLWKEKGLSPQAAGAQVNRFMQTFSKTPDLVRKLSRKGVMNPVAGFLHESARIGANHLVHNTPFAMAMTSALPAINFQMLAMSGSNPYTLQATMRANDSKLPLAIQAATSLFVPINDGEAYDTWTIPGFNLFAPTKMPMSAAAEAVLGSGADNGYEPSLLDTAVKAPIAHFFNGTGINMAVAALSGQDFETGGTYNESGAEWLGGAVKVLSDIAMPPWVPFVGARWRRTMDAIDRPPRTGTEKQKGFWEAVGDSVGLRHRGVDLQDRLAISVRRAKARTPTHRAVAQEPLWQDYRAAGYAELVAQRDGDPKALAAATAHREEIQGRLLDKVEENQLLHQYVQSKDPSRKQEDALRIRMLRSFNWKAGFSDLDLPQTTDVLLEMQPQMSKGQEKYIRQLVSLAMRRGDWLERERSFSNIEQIDNSIEAINTYLQAPRSQVGVGALRMFKTHLVRQKYARLSGELNSRARDTWRLQTGQFSR